MNHYITSYLEIINSMLLDREKEVKQGVPINTR